ncbi:MAG: M48 family metallopeptidase [Clostridiales bacterium]|jgi:predicted metal-dependent hydrolase|nr:M48 family metallopeptidase [Clostridiales bacterium]
MSKIIRVSHIEIEVNKKKIKNMYLKVSRQDGKVSVSAPLRTKDDIIKRFVASKLDWIDKQVKKFENRKSLIDLEYKQDEIHYVWGKPYSLEIKYENKKGVEILDDKLILAIHKDSTIIQREKLLIEWYRKQLKERLPDLVEKWEYIIGVSIESVRVRNMTTRWGTCNTRDKRICFNLQLAKKPLRCLEYVVVHELVHLLEPSHNVVFKNHMDKYLPNWREIKRELNS